MEIIIVVSSNHENRVGIEHRKHVQYKKQPSLLCACGDWWLVGHLGGI